MAREAFGAGLDTQPVMPALLGMAMAVPPDVLWAMGQLWGGSRRGLHLTSYLESVSF